MEPVEPHRNPRDPDVAAQAGHNPPWAAVGKEPLGKAAVGDIGSRAVDSTDLRYPGTQVRVAQRYRATGAASAELRRSIDR